MPAEDLGTKARPITLLRLPIVFVSGCKATVSFPFPSRWNEQGTCPVLTPLLAITIASFSSCCRVWLDYRFPHVHVTNTYAFHWTEAHLPSAWVTSKYHLSETLCVTLHDFLVEWEHDLGLADNICLYICLYFFWTLSYQLLLCRHCTCMRFQVSFPMRELHGRRKNSINCSCCLMSSVLKQRSYIRCWGFFLSSEYSGVKPTQIFIVHQISMRFFNA